MKKIDSRTGSSLVETSCLALILTSILSVGLYISSLSVAKMWLQHCLYENLLCNLKSEVRCREKFEKQAAILSWGHVTLFESQQQFTTQLYKTIQGHVSWCNLRKGAQCKTEDLIEIKMKISEKNLAGLR